MLNPLQATQVLSETYTQNTITYNYTGGNIQYEGTDAKYSYYNEDKYINIGPFQIRPKLILVNSFNTTNNRTAVNLNYFLWLEFKNPEGYACQGTINITGNTNLNTNDFGEIYSAHLYDMMTENNGYDLNRIKNKIYQNFNTPEYIYNQIQDMRTTIDSEGMGWDEEDYRIVKTDQNYTQFNSVIQNLNQRNKTFEIEKATEETEPDIWVETAKLYAEIDYIESYQKEAYKNMLNNVLEGVQITINYIGPNITPTVEVIDIPGLIFTILGMPFAWMSTAFNFTLFPGTPYAINISHIVLAIVTAGILLFIIKKVLK